MLKLTKQKGSELLAVKFYAHTTYINVWAPHKDIVADFNEIFVNELPTRFPRQRKVDFEVNLKSDEPPPARPVIRLGPEELKELKNQIQQLLEKGFIRPSSSTTCIFC